MINNLARNTTVLFVLANTERPNLIRPLRLYYTHTLEIEQGNPGFYGAWFDIIFNENFKILGLDGFDKQYQSKKYTHELTMGFFD